jgi:hypothetical protein
MCLRREAFYLFDEGQRAASLHLRDCTDLHLLLEHLQALIFDTLVRESVVLQQATVGSSMISCRTSSASECTVATVPSRTRERLLLERKLPSPMPLQRIGKQLCIHPSHLFAPSNRFHRAHRNSAARSLSPPQTTATTDRSVERQDSLVLVVAHLLHYHLLRLSSASAVRSVSDNLLHAPLLLHVVRLNLRRVLLEAVRRWRALRVHRYRCCWRV